jgi:hypothetical protein
VIAYGDKNWFEKHILTTDTTARWGNFLYDVTIAANTLVPFGFSHRRNDHAEVRVCMYMVRANEISPAAYRCMYRSQKAMHRFGIGGIYCSRYILIYIGDLGLTGFGNLARPYLVLLSHQLTAAAATLSCCSRERNTQFETRYEVDNSHSNWLITHLDERSVRNSKNWVQHLLSLTRRGFV